MSNYVSPSRHRGLRALLVAALGLPSAVGCDNPSRDAGTISVGAAKAKAVEAESPPDTPRGKRSSRAPSAATGRSAAPGP